MADTDFLALDFLALDFLALLEQGAESWNQWRKNNPDVKPDLRSAYLFGQALSGFNLSEANLERACLIDANLRGANLSKACLRSAYVSSANLENANLSEADLSLGNFSEANFSQATLHSIQANGTNFSQARFTGAFLSSWQIDPNTKLHDLRGSYVYLRSKQRSPEQGKFKPEELAALIKQMPSIEVGSIKAPINGRIDGRIKASAEAKEKASVKTSAKAPTVARSSGHNRPRAVLVGLGSAAIALLGLTTLFRSNSPAPASIEPKSARFAQQLSSVSLPCQDIKVTPTLPGSAAHQYKNGIIYYGEFANGQPADGKGTMVYPSGNRYDGEYQNGDRSGCGVFGFSNGRRYIGQFEADQFNGQGTWILETGERYIGEFKNNQCDGKGTFIFFNGSYKSGIWEKGKLLNDDLSCDQGGLNLPLSSYQ